jgi:hypothetical protein
LREKSEVNLFTRPRRFGKSLNLSMLQHFFENTGAAALNEERQKLFEGLKIMDAEKSVLEQMTGYPVILLSLKSARQPTFGSAYYQIREELRREYERHAYVLDFLTGKRQRDF